jgi:hypothetical protein
VVHVKHGSRSDTVSLWFINCQDRHLSTDLSMMGMSTKRMRQ